jgi:hypothetical protein
MTVSEQGLAPDAEKFALPAYERRPSGRTSTLLAPGKRGLPRPSAGRRGDRAVPGQTENQDSCRGRRARSAAGCLVQPRAGRWLSRRFYRPFAPPAQVHAAYQQRWTARRGSTPSAAAPSRARCTQAGHGRPTRSTCRRTHAGTTSRSKLQPRPSSEEASQPTPPPDGTARPETGPHYTNWSRPILRLV